MKKKKLLFPLVLLLIPVMPGAAQKIDRIEPPSWFTGMKEPVVQLMAHGENIGSCTVTTDYPGVSVGNITRTDNSNYLFVDLIVDKSALPGTVNLTFNTGKKKLVYDYLLLNKTNDKTRAIDASDVIYLIMPDRYANGDPSNDNITYMLEKADRLNPGGRHGGDLKGISDHLDYMSDLGVTALWINPFLENNQPAYSYHGYSVTDMYKTDPRFGSNEDFRSLVTKAHNMDMTIIMDMIFNHIGSGHWWMNDLPSKEWIHHFDTFTRTNYRTSSYMDPYAASADLALMEKGWFDITMPDLNHDNPLVETYLTQNSLWWIAWSGIDGIRMDTYTYPQKEMMSRWAKRVTDEFPGFFIVGEVWYQQEALTAYWSLDKKNDDGYISHLPSLTDFPLSLATHRAFTETDNWTDGVARLYLILSQDFLYPHPRNNLIFLDNHDLTRFFTQTGQRMDVYKMAMAFIMTTRGIPQFYYGTEIAMTGDKNDGDGYLRKDFPGGWPGDVSNAFSETWLSDTETAACDFSKKLLNWRKTKEVIHNGKLKHYIPDNGLYVYFRYDNSESVMVILNNSETDSRRITRENYPESMQGFTEGYEVITGTVIKDLTSFTIGPKTAMIIELK